MASATSLSELRGLAHAKGRLFPDAEVLTERGAEPHQLEPATDVWKLREPLRTVR